MNMVAVKPKKKVSPLREQAKNIIRAYKIEYGRFPTVKEALEISGFSRIVIEPALDVVMAEDGKVPEVKLNKKQMALVNAKLKILSKQLESEFNDRVRLSMLEHNESYRTGLEKLREEAAQKEKLYNQLINNYKPIFTEDEFRTIIACLHPDNSASKERRESAFNMVNIKKIQLTGKR